MTYSDASDDVGACSAVTCPLLMKLVRGNDRGSVHEVGRGLIWTYGGFEIGVRRMKCRSVALGEHCKQCQTSVLEVKTNAHDVVIEHPNSIGWESFFPLCP